MSQKTCSMCGLEKPLSEFRKESKPRPGVRANCRQCDTKRHAEWRAKNREHLRRWARGRYRNRGDKWAYHIKRKYGITPVQYDEMLSRQKGKCAICGKSNRHNKQGRFNIDHCHLTGVIRGLLCWECNVAIGRMGDDPNRLRKAAEYLDQSLPRKRKHS